jgi:uncharacterized protein
VSSNAERVRALYLNLECGDIPAVLDALSPRIRWREADGFPYPGPFVGPAAVNSGLLARFRTDWRGFAAVCQRTVCEGNTVVALGEYSGVCRATGKSMLVPFVHVWTLRAGRAEGCFGLADTALFQRALQ